MTVEPFSEFLASISRLGGTATVDPETRAMIDDAAAALGSLPVVDRASLADLVQQHPAWVPALGLCAGLSQEQLKNTLRHRLGSAGWITLAKTRPADVVGLLDEDYGLVALVEDQRARHWSFADVLMERASSRSKAAGSQARGRSVEDQVQAIVDGLGLPRQMRARFDGIADRSAPCDLAIPVGGRAAQIVVGIKGVRLDWEQAHGRDPRGRGDGNDPPSHAVRVRRRGRHRVVEPQG